MSGIRTPQIRVRQAPEPVRSVRMSPADRATTQMAVSLLLDYPDAAYGDRLQVLRREVGTLPAPVRAVLLAFLDDIEPLEPAERERRYVATFDLKRKCCMYLSYYAAGDTRRRGAALVAFLEAYRAAGWEFDAEELPDYLPAVLEFAARSGSPVGDRLLASHREGIEVLRAALLAVGSPYADLIEAVGMSLAEIDERTRERYLRLINEGPPTESVGLGGPVELPPFIPVGAAAAEVRS
ncbi:nitrate reductase molybdenum cofactor assembly chaperone [Agromyces sp. Marseille-P2726]|uniref:nitrate reductase molybdenum cofactor assembly chaperone n=1 Tax=Agromyces sp. Marseille-P2726 TaxID=2709132 RepID=UPI00156F581D|nr:nitrate reductase molybdenum cofactor assembly chaperone [Agromyces sp. Marseille-P2726]